MEGFEYSAAYDVLLMSEADFDNYVTDAGLGTVDDWSIKMASFDAPETTALTAMNQALLHISMRRDLICKQHIRAIELLGCWQSLAVQAEAFYKTYFEFLSTLPEVKEEAKTLKTVGERESAIHRRMAPVLELTNRVSRHYMKDGNVVSGMAFNYRLAVKDALEDLDAKQETTSRQFAIFTKMKELGM